MSKVRMVAIEPCNGYVPGQDFEVTMREAAQLQARGLARPAVAVAVESKKPDPAPRKASPSPAAGEGARSSASPVAQASPQTTSKRSGAGAARPQQVRAPRKTVAASSR